VGGTKEGIEMALRFASAMMLRTVAGVVGLDVVNVDLAGVAAAFGVFVEAVAVAFEGVGAALCLEFPFWVFAASEVGGLNEKALDAGGAVAVSLGAELVPSAGVDSDVRVGLGVGFENPRKSNARESLFF
jgi:hypothetical protein